MAARLAGVLVPGVMLAWRGGLLSSDTRRTDARYSARVKVEEAP